MMDGREGHGAVRVVVADDDPIVRRALMASLLEHGISVLAEACDGAEAVEQAGRLKPAVVLMDIVMPGVDGVEASRRLREEAPEVRVLLVAGSDDDELAMAGLRAGAAGFVRKRAGPAEISAAVVRTAAGEAVVDPEVIRALVESLQAAPETDIGLRPTSSTMTDREWQMLDCLCVGLSVEQIAAAYVLSVDTVRTHVKNIYRKLDVHSHAEAVSRAATLRRASPPPT